MKKRTILLLVFAVTLLLAGCGSENSTSSYQIFTSAVPANAGSVSPGSGTFQEGYKLEISAKPANNTWRFDHWSGGLQGTSATMTITVHEAKNIKAHFVENKYDLTIKTEGQGSVSQKVVPTSSASGYKAGTVVELMAKPAKGWIFVKFTGNLTTTDNPAQLKVDKAKEVTAVFKKQNYKLTVNTKGQGTVDQKVIPKSGTADYKYDTTVQLTAKPSTGWEFVKWTGDLSGSKNPDQITIDDPKEVTAVFKKKTFALTIKTEGQGTVKRDPEQQKYVYKTAVKLTATPAKGWTFVKFKGDFSSTDNPATVTVDKAKEVTAVFEKHSYKLTISTEGQGSVSKSPDQASYAPGTKVTVTASPDNGWSFKKWEGDLSGTNKTLSVTMDASKSGKAVFEKVNLFYLGKNGVTIKCPNAKEGDSGTVDGVTYTKRSAKQITTSNAPTTCTSGITIMDQMFYNATSFNGDISSWDVSSVISMEKMFLNAKSFNQDLSDWDVSSVTRMGFMFDNASDFNRDLSGWNVSSVTDMTAMFAGAKSFNQDLNDWDVSSVNDMGSMFAGGSSFNRDISGWDVGNVIDMSAMFKGASSFNQDLSGWDVSSVTNMDQMFSKAVVFNSDLNSWDVSHVTKMSLMFFVASAFNGDISSWDVSAVTTMGSMFKGASSFNKDIGSWDVSAVSDMSTMFSNAKAFNQDLSG